MVGPPNDSGTQLDGLTGTDWCAEHSKEHSMRLSWFSVVNPPRDNHVITLHLAIALYFLPSAGVLGRLGAAVDTSHAKANKASEAGEEPGQ